MPIAYVEAIGGAAGDMFLGALIDAGLDTDDLLRELERLGLPDVGIRVDRVEKQHINAAQFEVLVGGREEHQHHHDERAPGRTFAQIRSLIESSALRRQVKDRAGQIFRLLGEAEAKVHGVAIDDVHFHEIGAVDSIVDIVGAAIAVDLMQLDTVYCSPLPVGSGFVETRHGLYPVPAPATLEILASAGVPTRPSRVEAEQVTPTGAAILTALARFEQPAMRPLRIGYGAGHADLTIPNVLRVWIGEMETSANERISVLQTNVDDMTPEVSAHVVERCLQEGALDALLIPVVMKKGRPGVQIEVLCRPDRLDHLRGVLFAETPTLGVRWWEVERQALARELRVVQTLYGPIGVKVRVGHDGAAGVSPEYEDCRRAAEAANVPLSEVYRAAILAAERSRG